MRDRITDMDVFLEQRLAQIARERATLQLRLEVLDQERLALEAEVWRRVVAATTQAPTP